MRMTATQTAKIQDVFIITGEMMLRGFIVLSFSITPHAWCLADHAGSFDLAAQSAPVQIEPAGDAELIGAGQKAVRSVRCLFQTWELAL
jgi:hypothetical protein